VRVGRTYFAAGEGEAAGAAGATEGAADGTVAPAAGLPLAEGLGDAAGVLIVSRIDDSR